AFHSGSSFSESTMDPSGVQRLLEELAADDVAVRLSAAKSLQLVLYQLEKMRATHDQSTGDWHNSAEGQLLQQALAAVCMAVGQEEDDSVLRELLTDAFHFGKTDPDTVLDALARGKATRWTTPNGVAGQSLVLLGNVVSLRPERVAQLL